MLFRAPIRDLLHRIRSFEGMGQKLTFGEKLAGAETAVEEALRTVTAENTTPASLSAQPDSLGRDAEAMPSVAVLQSWQRLAGALAALASAAQPAGKQIARPGVGVAELLHDMQLRDVINSQFSKAVLDLRDLRDRVAHGEHTPTAGEAAAYVASTRELTLGARTLAQLLPEDESVATVTSFSGARSASLRRPTDLGLGGPDRKDR
jgi:hypothetical protein